MVPYVMTVGTYFARVYDQTWPELSDGCHKYAWFRRTPASHRACHLDSAW